jgi:hypothetical protein
MEIILESQRNTQVVLFPISDNTEAGDVLVARIVLIVIIKSCLEIQGMRKEAEVLCKTDCESVKKAGSCGLICSQIQSPVV